MFLAIRMIFTLVLKRNVQIWILRCTVRTSTRTQRRLMITRLIRFTSLGAVMCLRMMLRWPMSVSHRLERAESSRLRRKEESRSYFFLRLDLKSRDLRVVFRESSITSNLNRLKTRGVSFDRFCDSCNKSRAKARFCLYKGKYHVLATSPASSCQVSKMYRPDQNASRVWV